MVMWAAIMIIALTAWIGCLLVLIKHFGGFFADIKWVSNNKWKRRLLGVACICLICLVLVVTVNVVNMAIVILHLTVIWLLCDVVKLIIGKLCRKHAKNTRTNQGSLMTGVLAIAITTVYLGIGWYIDHHAVETNYKVETAKEVGDGIRVAMFADSHVGAVFHADRFAQYMKEIEQLEPDVLLISGDFVDDDTSREDMTASCAALGNTKTTYGVYYVFGNHDKGYANYRNFTAQDLVDELKKNNVTVLEDESILINDCFYIIGRADRSFRGRMSMQELTKDLDTDKFMIVMDHQPYDYKAQEESGVDLVLSGHTHGGQLIPFNRMGQWTGVDAKSYGLEKRTNTSFVVTSGIADWAIKFKTGCVSEYTIIDVTG